MAVNKNLQKKSRTKRMMSEVPVRTMYNPENPYGHKTGKVVAENSNQSSYEKLKKHM